MEIFLWFIIWWFFISLLIILMYILNIILNKNIIYYYYFRLNYIHFLKMSKYKRIKKKSRKWMRKINLWFTGYRSHISILDYYVCSIWRVYDNVFNWIWYTIIDEIIYCFLFTNQIWNWTTYCMSLMVTIVLVVGALLVNFWIVGCSMMVCFMNMNYVMNFQPDPLRKNPREEEKIKLSSLPLLFSAPFQMGCWNTRPNLLPTL